MQSELQTQQQPYAGTQDIAVRENKVLRNTYLLLAVSLIPTIVGAAVGTAFFDFAFLGASPIIASFAILAVFYGWIYMIERNKDSALGVGLLLGFTLFMGLLLGPLLQKLRGNPASRLEPHEEFDPEQICFLIIRPKEPDDAAAPRWLPWSPRAARCWASRRRSSWRAPTWRVAGLSPSSRRCRSPYRHMWPDSPGCPQWMVSPDSGVRRSC